MNVRESRGSVQTATPAVNVNLWRHRRQAAPSSMDQEGYQLASKAQRSDIMHLQRQYLAQRQMCDNLE
jgi:hypothetical protein